MAHEHSEFLVGTTFLNKLMLKPFGLMQYVGAWLTQFFYVPACGTSILATLWISIFLVGCKAFKLQGTTCALMLLPIACLLTTVVDLGYWIYILKENGYWFSHSLGYLAMLLLLWIAASTPRQYHLLWYLLAGALYPVLGWYTLLFVLCLVLSDKLSWRELVGVVSLVFVGSIWHAFYYSESKLVDVLMGGFPCFVTPTDNCDRLAIPFKVLGIITILIPLCKKYLEKVFVPVLCAILGISFTIALMFSDQNYINEMRMVRAAQEDKWQEVITIAAESQMPTISMAMLKNVALMNEGGLLDRSFKLGNNNDPSYNPDSLHVSFLEIAAPLVYYNYGMINEAIRLSYECAVQAGFSPFYLKTIARCARATGEKKLEDRFVTLLHHHPGYKHWQPEYPSEKVRELQFCYSDEITGVENSYSYLVGEISLWKAKDSKLVSEQALFYSMIQCDARRFWPSLRRFLNRHQGEEFPVHTQEAYILFIDKSPEENRMMVPVSQEIYDRYKLFWTDLENIVRMGKTLNDAKEELREKWGDTYWYYNLLGRKFR